jgi:hypothetical protein
MEQKLLILHVGAMLGMFDYDLSCIHESTLVRTYTGETAIMLIM